MMSLTLEEIRMSVQGEWISSPVGGVARSVSTDSREIEQGDLFVAIEGEKHDGHDFVGEAAKKGAVAALVSRRPAEINETDDFGLLRVEDTVEALCDLADYYRSIINADVVAVTGSGGKTTTKEVTAHLLSLEFNVARSPKSYNNHIGVPLSLFQVDPVHDFAVLEIGTNRPGEIEELSSIARPDIGILTNITETHLEGLGSIEGVKREKADLFHHLTGDGFAVYNADSQHVVEVVEELDISGFSFGVYNKAHLMASNIQSTLEGIQFTVKEDVEVQFPVPGAWNVYNVLAGMVVAEAAGIDLQKAADSLKDFQPPSMRMQIEDVNDVRIINDAYNANPRSVQLILDELEHYDWNGRKIVVLGDMAELGARSEELHRDVGERIDDLAGRIDQVYFVGEKMKYAAEEVRRRDVDVQVHVDNDVDETIQRLAENVRPGDLLLLKGSRVMELEKIVDALKTEPLKHQLQQQ